MASVSFSFRPLARRNSVASLMIALDSLIAVFCSLAQLPHPAELMMRGVAVSSSANRLFDFLVASSRKPLWACSAPQQVVFAGIVR